MQLDLCIMLIFVKIDNGMFNTAKKITDKLTNKIKEEGLSLIVIFSLFLVSLFLFKFKMVNLFIDFGREITVPKSMINGQVLYKDIFCLYGPFSYLFNAFVLKLTKIHLTTFHILGWINTFLILNGIYFISRNFLNKTLSSLITIFVMWVCAFVPFVTNYITPYSYATVYGLCSITLSVIFLYKFIDKDKNIFLYLSFLLSGIAFANKFEYLFCLIVTLTACIYKKCKIKYYIFGLTIWLLPTLLCYFLLFIQGLTIQDYKNYFEIILRYINTPSLKEFYAGTMTFSLTPFLTESVMFLVSAFIFGAIYKTAKIYVNDSGLETTLENKGTGTQSCVIISLFVQYCKMMHRSGSLLAIEEPECYLHPHARRALSSYLDSFIQNDGNYGKPNNQIILTTHSPEFLKGTQLENVHVLRKDVSGTSTVSSIPPNDAGIKEYKQKIEMIINREDAEMFFADCVILVEGGEKHLLPLIADLKREGGLVDNPLDRYNISVVRVGGKGNFKVYVTLLKRLGIPYYLIADFDMLYGGGELRQLESNDLQWNLGAEVSDTRNEILRKWTEAIKSNFPLNERSAQQTLCSPHSYDGQAMCRILDEVCTNGEITDDLRNLWEYIKDRHRRKKINYSSVKERITDPSLIPLDEILRKLFEDEHIYILREGELEDYYSERGCSIPGGKEVKALGIADAVCTDMRNSQENTIENYLNVSEYQLVINQAIQDCKNRLHGDS